MTVTEPSSIRFNDGAAYERGMGVWSRLAGDVFLDWLSPPGGLRWVDIGCGNGAFTERLATRCAPSEIEAVDPSEGQLSYARSRPGVSPARFQVADAMDLPFKADRFDAAVMALVIFFVPDPAIGLTEMLRVVRPGGLISAYAWDVPGGGLPFEPLRTELAKRGTTLPVPPSSYISPQQALRGLWVNGGLRSVETRVIEVSRTFPDFETFWSTNMGVGVLGEFFARMEAAEVEDIKNHVRRSLGVDSGGGVTCSGTANAVRGFAPD